MANSDYKVNGNVLGFASSARLAASVGRGDTLMYFSTFHNPVGVLPVAGDTVMIGNEIMRIDVFTGGSLTLARGCMDTVPTNHAAGSSIWFLRSAVGTDNVTYADG